MKKTNSSEGLKKCLNCETDLVPKMKFCTECGQPNRATSLSIRETLKEFAENVFNLDGRLFMTLKNIWRPAHLTREYFSGKRKTYLLPTQFFLFSIFLFFALTLFYIPGLEQLQRLSGVKELERNRLAEAYDTISSNYVCDIEMQNDMRKQLFKRKEGDTLFFPSKLYFSNLEKYKISYEEVYSGISADSIIKKHMIESWQDQFLLRGCIKFEFNPVGTVKFLLGNLSWSIVLLIFFMAGFSKLLWIRHYSYYLEHLILWINTHSMLFAALSILLLFEKFIFKSEFISVLTIVILISLVLYSVQNYFKDSILKLLIKTLILTIIYVTGLSFSMLLVFLISIIFL